MINLENDETKDIIVKCMHYDHIDIHEYRSIHVLKGKPRERNGRHGFISKKGNKKLRMK